MAAQVLSHDLGLVPSNASLLGLGAALQELGKLRSLPVQRANSLGLRQHIQGKFRCDRTRNSQMRPCSDQLCREVPQAESIDVRPHSSAKSQV